ncbi:MAG: outer-membrane lipoprotein carrier protein LolA [Duncaniella sp.]|nr:outer-membrane lipoprotein carrier protein LolA [Duncaniella sp.]MDE6178428.1 outer-membrane lipoprotein carrier protein LolA [Duncaniella sp.]
MKRHLLTLLLLLAGVCASMALTPAQMIERSAESIRKPASLKAFYTLKADGETVQGVLTMSGQMFTISTPTLSVWFDGKTQWTYSTQMGEVNIVNPTRDELRQINPLEIISSLSGDFALSALKAPKGFAAVGLTAKAGSTDIRRADITFSTATWYPSAIHMTLSNRQTVSVTIDRIEAGSVVQASAFRFDPKRYPGVQVIDLR